MENKLQGTASPEPTVKAEVSTAGRIEAKRNLKAIISPDPGLKVEVFNKDGNLLDERRN